MEKVKIIDLNEDLYEVTSESIIAGVKKLPLKKESASDTERIVAFGHFIGIIADEPTLTEVTAVLRQKGFLEKLEGFNFPSIGKPDIDHKIKSTLTGLSLICEHLAMFNEEINNLSSVSLINGFAEKLPQFQIQVDETIFKHNLPELVHFVRKKFIASMECLGDGFNEPDKRRHLKNLISVLSQLDYKSDNAVFGDDIAYLTTQLDTIVSERPVLPERFYKTFTPTGYRLFLHIMENYVQAENEGLAADVAYYYQKMKVDDYMHGKQVDFSDWFFEHYNVSVTKFRPLDELETPDRRRNYYDALEWLKQS
ncbi:hypothetical protein FLLO111716_01170 [Flavobacterium longum]|uniref:hypothetical protein n=1 Tax=Flavobacterium longum TaxID=1299340 RepID=UPI0039EA90DE